ncbi:prepilin-type N-terminal cleavage/methylation domain-containing protein [Candidatus Sumerlaeota bacterium]|nr:prepilin-type N-terminal cleavage/methylation domain-containing protein [Candidatus Sumerlaeota bacterium]
MWEKYRKSKNKGFTLIEILVVGALIALFAGLAIINIQQQFQTNLRKITIAETKEIGTALSFAYQDVGIFPKFCFLNRSINMLYSLSGSTQLPPSFDYMGFDLTGIQQRIVSQWKGGYFAMSQTRNRIAQGRGGVLRVYIPGLNEPIDWPADPWGNPYVLYLLYLRGDDMPDFIITPTQEPDFFCAVVSYGPNHVPGGTDKLSPSMKSTLEGLRLYEKTGNPQVPYLMLPLSGYSQRERALVFSNKYLTTLGQTPGIADPGSDDVFFRF